MSIQEFFSEWIRMTVGLKEAEKGRLIDSIAYHATETAEIPLNGKEACLLPVFCNLINEKQNGKVV